MKIEHPPVFPAPRPRPAGPVFKANGHIVDASNMVKPTIPNLEATQRKTPTLADEWATAKRIITKWLQGGYA